MGDILKKDVLLIFPPLVKHAYRQIYPSLPVLAASLREAGFRPAQLELNNEFYDWLYGSPHASRLMSRLKLSLGDEGLAELPERYPRSPRGLRAMMSRGGELESLVDNFYRTFFKGRRAKKPILIGLSIAMLPQLIPSLILVRSIRRHLWRDARIVLGGPVMTLVDDSWRSTVADLSGADAIILGEGEEAIVHLAEKAMSDARRRSDRGRSTVRGGALSLVYEENPERSLDSYPPPLYDRKNLRRWGVGRLAVVVGRKCYWGKCAYCEYQGLYSDLKIKSPRNVVRNMRFLKDEYGISDFDFICDAIEPNYAVKLSREIVSAGLECGWMSYLRIDPRYSEASFKLMKESGCNVLAVGVESLDDGVLRRIDKGYSSRTAIAFVKKVLRSGIYVQLNMIIDLPGTTYESAKGQLMALKRVIRGAGPGAVGRIVTYRLGVSSSTKLGMHPSRYGIELKPGAHRCLEDRVNLVSFVDPKGMTRRERNDIEASYNDLNDRWASGELNG